MVKKNVAFQDRFKQERKNTKNDKLKTIRISLNNNKNFRHKNIREIYDSVIKKGTDASKISIVAMAIDGWRTIKTFGTSFKNWDEEEYYKEKDIDQDKFDSYEFFDITIRK